MTPRTRKHGIAAVLLVVIALTIVLWPRPRYTYKGRTVEEWLKQYVAEQMIVEQNPTVVIGVPLPSPAETAFIEIGTNALPFLESVCRPRRPWVERLITMLPQRFRPGLNDRERSTALSLMFSIDPIAFDPRSPSP